MVTRFILWISMVFLTGFTTRSVTGQGTETMCYTAVNRDDNLMTYKYEIPLTGDGRKFVYTNYTERNRTCCSGFANESGICACSIGWGGVSCNEPLLCLITKTDQVNHSETVSKVPSVKSVTNNPVIDSNKLVDECLPKCQDQLNSTILVGRSANRNYYFIHKGLPCNVIPVHQMFWIMYIIGSVIVLGIIMLLLLIFGIVYIIRKKRRAKDTRNDDPIELIRNDENSWQQYDDVVPAENHIYDDIHIQPNRIYDDVIVGPLIHTYDNVHVIQPISDYDDVNVVPIIGDYDDVNIEPIQISWSRTNQRVVTIGTPSRIKKS